MTTDLMPFTYKGTQLRTVVIDGEPWFVAADACAMLELRDTTSAMKMVDDDDKQNIRRSDTPHFFEGMAPQVQTFTAVNESGIYALIFQSNKDKARDVRRWVTREVLPAIRKTGSYSVAPQFAIPQTMGEALRLAADQFDRAELEAARADAAESKVAELEPKADLADAILIAQGGARLVGQAAKLFAMKEKDLRRFLLDEKLVFTRHAPCGAIQWEHYAEFAHHFQARETVVNHTYGTCTHYTLRILPRGIELIRKRMRDAGMLDLAATENTKAASA